MRSNQVNIGEAKSTFIKLIKRVQRGEEIIIARAGEPVAKLVPMAHKGPRAKFGFGKGTVRGDFSDPMPDDWLDEF